MPETNCMWPECGTILRKGNRKYRFCSVHQRRMDEYNLTYRAGKFYKMSAKYKHGKKKEIRTLQTTEAILAMKETTRPEDFLMRDHIEIAHQKNCIEVTA